MITTQASYTQRIDADVHVRWQQDSDLLPCLPRGWHERWLHGAGHTQAGVRIQPKLYDPCDTNNGSPVRTVGAQAADDPASLIRDWLEPHTLDAALLSVYDAPILSTFGDIVYPMEVARAINRWLADTWLEADPRFHGSIVVATQDPEEAAAEVRRAAASHPRMVQVMLPAGTQFSYGHRRYYPIYKAAVDCGLAIAIHAGTEGVGTSHPPTPCGWPGTLAELGVSRSTTFLGHLTSLVTEGAFVQFPELKIAAFETGIAWLPTYLWRFDKNYKGLRSECPWLTELPSAHVRKHFRFGSQGAEPAPDPAQFWRLLRSTGGDDMVMYSSNAPRWDAEAPDDSYVLTSCPSDKRERIWSSTALEIYPRLSKASAALSPTCSS
ncbi:MAG TPA: amidohydrolase family protein [Candidatus Methylacidiphilales bacterium]|nr:amidohydrolase family protein [Candidatus Methylacidiphilales bacterium]